MNGSEEFDDKTPSSKPFYLVFDRFKVQTEKAERININFVKVVNIF